MHIVKWVDLAANGIETGVNRVNGWSQAVDRTTIYHL